jgi:hypothetical protein
MTTTTSNGNGNGKGSKASKGANRVAAQLKTGNGKEAIPPVAPPTVPAAPEGNAKSESGTGAQIPRTGPAPAEKSGKEAAAEATALIRAQAQKRELKLKALAEERIAIAIEWRQHEEGNRAWLSDIGERCAAWLDSYTAWHGSSKRSEATAELCNTVQDATGEDIKKVLPRCLQTYFAAEVFGRDVFAQLPVSSQKQIGTWFVRTTIQDGAKEVYVLKNDHAEHISKLFAIACSDELTPEHLKGIVKRTREGFAHGAAIEMLGQSLKDWIDKREGSLSPWDPAYKGRVAKVKTPVVVDDDDDDDDLSEEQLLAMAANAGSESGTDAASLTKAIDYAAAVLDHAERGTVLREVCDGMAIQGDLEGLRAIQTHIAGVLEAMASK